VVHDRQLPALAHVARVRQQLAHELDDGFAAHQVGALLAVRREQHVARLQRHGLRHRHGFLAEGAHIEGDLSLALGALHAVVEDAGVQHVPQADLQVFVVEPRIPGTDGLVLVVEHADQSGGAFLHLARTRVDVGLGDRSRGRQLDVRKVGLVSGPGRRAWGT
jgi:hypothetical protein